MNCEVFYSAEYKPIWKSIVNLDLAVPLVVDRHWVWRNLSVSHLCKIWLRLIVPHDAKRISETSFGQLLSAEINVDVIFYRRFFRLSFIQFLISLDSMFPKFASFCVPFDSRKLSLSNQLSIVSDVLVSAATGLLLFENHLVFPNFIF